MTDCQGMVKRRPDLCSSFGSEGDASFLIPAIDDR